MELSTVLMNINHELQIVEERLEQSMDFEQANLKFSTQQMLKAGGKRIRPAFVLLAGKIYQENASDELISLATAVELVHMSTLIHDDIIDKSEIRRGQPTIRSLWGNKFALHTGDYLFTQAMKLINPEEYQDIIKLLSHVSVEMCKGEIRQLISTYDIQQTVKDYFYKIKRKTALLIAASCQAGGMITNASDTAAIALYNYGYNLGMAFQIKDDVLDIIGDKKTIGKPVGDDLLQGVLTLPIILTLHKQKQDTAVLRLKELIVTHFPQPEKSIPEAIEIIRNNGAIEKSQDFAEKYIQRAKNQLRFLPTGPITETMADLADYINVRNV